MELTMSLLHLTCILSLLTASRVVALELKITPRDDVIYKLAEPLNTENWVVFLTLKNTDKTALPIDRLTFVTKSHGTVLSTISETAGFLLGATEIRKLPLYFFREHQAKNADELTIEVHTKAKVTIRKLKLERYVQTINLRLPLKGVWMVGSAHEYGISHRRWDNRAHFAWDFLKVDSEGKTAAKSGSDPKTHYAFGQDVIAPADATVLKVIDGFADHTVGEESPDANAVFLDLGNDLVAYLAHVRQGSVIVKEGERVKVGQKLAEVGNSGQSTLPHLHFHVQRFDRNATDPLKPGIPIPVDLSNYETINAVGSWEQIKSGHPERGAFLKDQQ